MVGKSSSHSFARRSSLGPPACLEQSTSSHTYSAPRLSSSMRMRLKSASLGMGTGHARPLVGDHTLTRSFSSIQACDTPQCHSYAIHHGTTRLIYRSQRYRGGTEELVMRLLICTTFHIALSRDSWERHVSLTWVVSPYHLHRRRAYAMPKS